MNEELNKIKDKIEKAEVDFKARKDRLDEKEQLFKRLDTKIEEMLSNSKDKLVRINIGGKIFLTKLEVLLTEKDTVFYKLVGHYIIKSLPIPEEFFFDRSPTYFEVLLNYLRFKVYNLRGYNIFEKEEILDEFNYYGLFDNVANKKSFIDVEWDRTLSKSGQCTVDFMDPKKLKVHSNSCYTHFVVNKAFKTEDFQIDLEVAVTQSDNFLYVGLYNTFYSLTGNCGCCNPQNAFYVQCDGGIHINATNNSNPDIGWNSQKVQISLKVYLSDAQFKIIYFYFPEKDLEKGPFNLTGNEFRVYAGHCNSGNGEINILDCYELKS